MEDKITFFSGGVCEQFDMQKAVSKGWCKESRPLNKYSHDAAENSQH